MIQETKTNKTKDEKTMVHSKNTQLIDNVFHAEDAQELIMDLLNAKINFHKLKNFSANIRFGKDDLESKNRAEVLENERIELLDFFADAKADKKTIRIHSTIQFSILD
jgi:hypothetical protein